MRSSNLASCSPPEQAERIAAHQAKHADDPDFAAFAELIAEQGYRASFEGIAYTYLRVDDHVYWSPRSLFEPGQNLNRRPAADVEHAQATIPGLTQERS